MVGTYESSHVAYPALEKECGKPKSSTKRSRKKAGRMLATTGGGVVLTFAAAPLAAVVGPAAPLIGASMGLAAKGGASKIGDEEIKRIGGKDIPHLARKNIKSVLRPQEPTLREVAGWRSGTRGNVPMKDLLPATIVHLKKAQQIYKADPYPSGHAPEVVGSCEDAEDLYRKLAEVDYHFSKAAAYAEALKELADLLHTYVTRNKAKLRDVWTQMEQVVKKELDQPEAWHRTNCGKWEHCYRTKKSKR
jgi:hypothetical protein